VCGAVTSPEQDDDSREGGEATMRLRERRKRERRSGVDRRSPTERRQTERRQAIQAVAVERRSGVDRRVRQRRRRTERRRTLDRRAAARVLMQRAVPLAKGPRELPKDLVPFVLVLLALLFLLWRILAPQFGGF
jgi:hypothetical protein